MVSSCQKRKVCAECSQSSFRDEDLIPIKAAAAFLSMSPNFVKKRAGRTIPVYKVGKSTRFKVGDLREYLATCRKIEN